jgi:hypothetical protein
VVERRSLAKTKGDAFEVVTKGMYHVHIDQLREQKKKTAQDMIDHFFDWD